MLDVGDGANILGDYLRARRELVTPDQVGLPVLGTRRVPGLRREEVAVSGTDGAMLVVHHAEAGSGSAERLARLGSVTASTPPGDVSSPTRSHRSSPRMK
ncbi:hypothetical protein GCM10027586_09440 [Kineococcus gypseus]